MVWRRVAHRERVSQPTVSHLRPRPPDSLGLSRVSVQHEGEAVPTPDAARRVEPPAEERIRVLGTESAVIRDLGPEPGDVLRREMFVQLHVRENPSGHNMS